ncbi:helix-turn-helix domain-containing protein [Actinoplanes sp. NPDC020271]|uniref:helix-turn-helix domain-containing protein n=1 Tax=Actinoplanes sp. NPDC020271 TaxID=3363896 RepID=UPI0037950348
MANPTIQRRRLGIALKRAREAAGKTQEDAAEVMDAAASKISRIEQGVSGLRLTDLGILLDFYGVSGPEADTMREMARAGRQRGRWSSYRESLPTWFRQYIDLEGDATEIRWYHAEIIPGLLQTESYVRALYAGSPAEKPEEAEKQIKIRLERTALVDAATSELLFVLSESALRRAVGSPATMAAQLEHLVEVSQRPNVSLQVLPFRADSYTTSSFPFIVLRFGPDSSTDVIYTEDYRDATYLDKYDDVKAYNRLWDDLRAAALGPVESARLLTLVASEFEEGGS